MFFYIPKMGKYGERIWIKRGVTHSSKSRQPKQEKKRLLSSWDQEVHITSNQKKRPEGNTVNHDGCFECMTKSIEVNIFNIQRKDHPPINGIN